MYYIKLLIFTFLTIVTMLGSINSSRADYYCSTEHSVDQDISALISEILEIQSVNVNATVFAPDDGFDNVAITSIDKTNSSSYVLSLSPMSVKVHTNLASPIYIAAEFLSLKSSNGQYIFNNSDLSFSPSQITVNSPYDGIVVGSFIPKVTTKSQVIPSTYTGNVLFTLGAL